MIYFKLFSFFLKPSKNAIVNKKGECEKTAFHGWTNIPGILDILRSVCCRRSLYSLSHCFHCDPLYNIHTPCTPPTQCGKGDLLKKTELIASHANKHKKTKLYLRRSTNGRFDVFDDRSNTRLFSFFCIQCLCLYGVGSRLN